ncbi:MAG: DUF4276 family protein [Bacteroidaceae bacterium]|nr:DUF4276 family protein [Bacteroidaceae bacterium]
MSPSFVPLSPHFPRTSPSFNPNILHPYFQNFLNSEDINDSPETTPSKRMQRLIQGYNKVTYGIEYTGIDVILQKCPHFRKWIETIKAVIA